MSKYLSDYKKKVATEKAKNPAAFKKKYKTAPAIVEPPVKGKKK